MNKKLLRLSLVCLTGAMIFTAIPQTAMAYEESVAGFPYDKSSSSDSSGSGATTISLSFSDIPIPGFNNIGIADVDTNLLIRSGAGEDYKIIGKIPRNGGVDIVESDKDGWTKISAETSTGTLVGYVKSEYLIIGSDARELAREVGNYVATAITDGLNVRKEPSKDADKIDQVAKGEKLVVLDDKVITDDPDNKIWVKVILESDTEEDGTIGYVSKNYVELSFELIHPLSMQEIEIGVGVSETRIDIVNKAKEYLGGRYLYGGTSLSNGIDCSAFVRAIYGKFGYSLPRTSRDQARSGDTISASQLKPGDLVFYGSSSYINHVAMFIGNGKVIHASNKKDGIKISNLYYRSPVKCVRYISN